MRVPILLLAVAAVGLWSAGAGATLERKRSSEPVGPDTGGVEVRIPADGVRVTCWQAGQKIIDEAGMALLSLGVASQANAITLGRKDGKNEGRPSTSVVVRNRTACLLSNEE
ncbi:MAG TPA: hypothetical protein VEB64_02055 [Azospirillaceae bacterium]|nr:hypothetical protein [Azospirillaceae bacterium]